MAEFKPRIMEEKTEYAPETCGHCGGLGCLYCDRSGTVMVAQPPEKCRHCDGVGCIYCGYTGWAGLLQGSRKKESGCRT